MNKERRAFKFCPSGGAGLAAYYHFNPKYIEESSIYIVYAAMLCRSINGRVQYVPTGGTIHALKYIMLSRLSSES